MDNKLLLRIKALQKSLSKYVVNGMFKECHFVYNLTQDYPFVIALVNDQYMIKHQIPEEDRRVFVEKVERQIASVIRGIFNRECNAFLYSDSSGIEYTLEHYDKHIDNVKHSSTFLCQRITKPKKLMKEQLRTNMTHMNDDQLRELIEIIRRKYVGKVVQMLISGRHTIEKISFSMDPEEKILFLVADLGPQDDTLQADFRIKQLRQQIKARYNLKLATHNPTQKY